MIIPLPPIMDDDNDKLYVASDGSIFSSKKAKKAHEIYLQKREISDIECAMELAIHTGPSRYEQRKQIKKQNEEFIDDNIENLDKVLSKKELNFYFSEYNYYITAHERCPERIQKLLIEDCPLCIKNIKNPTPALQKLAFDKNPKTLPYLTIDITEDMAMKAISIDPELIQYVKKQTPEMQNKVIAENPLYIRYINNPSQELIKLAISKNPRAINWISNPSYKLQKYALEVYKKEKDMKEFHKYEYARYYRNCVGFDTQKKTYSIISPFYYGSCYSLDISILIKIQATIFNLISNMKLKHQYEKELKEKEARKYQILSETENKHR